MAMDWNSTALPWQSTSLPWKSLSLPWNDTNLPWKGGSGAVGGGTDGQLDFSFDTNSALIALLEDI